MLLSQPPDTSAEGNKIGIWRKYTYIIKLFSLSLILRLSQDHFCIDVVRIYDHCQQKIHQYFNLSKYSGVNSYRYQINTVIEIINHVKLLFQ